VCPILAQDEKGHLPRPGSAEDAAELIAMAKSVNAASKEPLEEIEDDLVSETNQVGRN
jgi:hypothetical protein